MGETFEGEQILTNWFHNFFDTGPADAWRNDINKLDDNWEIIDKCLIVFGKNASNNSLTQYITDRSRQVKLKTKLYTIYQ